MSQLRWSHQKRDTLLELFSKNRWLLKFLYDIYHVFEAPSFGCETPDASSLTAKHFFPEILGIPFFTFNFSMVIFSFALTSNWRRENKHLTLADIFPFVGGLTFTTWIRWTYSSSGIGVAFFDGQKNPRFVTQLGMAKHGETTTQYVWYFYHLDCCMTHVRQRNLR